MQITSVEEGDTQEVEEGKGFGNPDDSSFDPPGTITIPLPPTVYEPPKPGEEVKEMPLPEMKLPASIFEGKSPTESITLSPDGTKLAPGTTLPLEHMAPDGTTSKVPLDLNPSTPVAAAPPPVLPPAPPLLLPVQTPVLTQPPVPAPPPPPPVSTGGSLPYPKLPPVMISEIPNRVNRQPPLLLPKPKVALAVAPVVNLPKPPVVPAINLPKPPPVHVTGEPVIVGGVAANVNAQPHVNPLTPVPACGKSCNAAPPKPAAAAAPARAPVSPPAHHVAADAPAPVHKVAQPVIEKQQDMRYGVSYGKSKRS